MASKKSKRYTVDGKQYAFGFDADGKINSVFNVSGRTGNKNPIPVNPNTSAFSDIVNSASGTDAYNKQKFKGEKDSYLSHADGGRAVQATSAELNSEYTKNSKSNTNEQYVEEENTDTVVENATPKESTSNASEIMSYPLDLNPSQDHFKITKYNYQRSDVNASKPGMTEIKTEKYKKESKSVRSKGYGTTEKKVNVAGDSVIGSDLLGSVLLPMPKATDVNGVEWGKSELTISGLAAVGLTDKLTGGGRLAGKSAEEAQNDKEIKKQIEANRGLNPDGSSVKQFGSALYAQTISKIAGFAFGTDLDVDTYLARSGGRVLNPNAEMLFQGPVIRDFNFSFLMIARSQREGDEIRKIIRFLKLGMAPKFRSTTYLKNPDIFTLHYKNGTGKDDFLRTVNQFNPGGLALTTMAVDYAPNGYWSAYKDSQPVAVKMDLSFTELRPIYEQDQLSTPEDSVGY
jgi:hypothetical protein